MKRTDNRSMVQIIQGTLNYVDGRLVNHGQRVAGTVCRMLLAQGQCDRVRLRDLSFLALIHDIGAYKTDEIDQMLRFESDEVWNHSIYGFLFVKHLTPLSALAPVILYHHAKLGELAGADPQTALWAQLFHLADRADVYLQNPNSDPGNLRAHLEKGRGTRFSDEALALYDRAAAVYGPAPQGEDGLLMEALTSIPYTPREMDAYFWTIISAIDFRSHHTVTHTVCTTSISQSLAERMGMAGEELEAVVSGARLHDLGKIGIPVEILEFPGKLSPQAMRVMRTHVGLTENILRGRVDPKILQIALRHHEKLDGSGYPRGLAAQALDAGQRIVAVADIVSALCGTRSYKDAFSKEKTTGILADMAAQNKIDPTITALLIGQYDEITARMDGAAGPVMERYRKINADYLRMMRQVAG